MSVDQQDCLACPYPRYKDGLVVFCDVCIRRILDEQSEETNNESEAQNDYKSKSDQGPE